MNLASGAIAHSKPVERRSSTTTSSPPSSRRQTMWLPMYPPPPVTSIVIAAFELPASFVGLLEGLRSELNWNPDAWPPSEQRGRHPAPSYGSDETALPYRRFRIIGLPASWAASNA